VYKDASKTLEGGNPWHLLVAGTAATYRT